MRLIILSVSFCTAPALAFAQAENCVDIEDAEARLACYDALFMQPDAEAVDETEPVAEATEETWSDRWIVRIAESEMTDDSNVFISQLSTDPMRCDSYRSSTVSLILRCQEDTTSVIIGTDCFLADHGGAGRVEYRIDDAPMSSRNFRESTSNNSLGLWNGGSAIPFIQNLFGGEKLLVRFRPYSGNLQTMSFDITGIEELVAPLREACHW